MGERNSKQPEEDPAELRLNLACARTFGTASGKEVLAWLHQSFISSIMGPEATDAALRYREGGRFVVASIELRIAAGRMKIGRRPGSTAR